MDQAIEEDLLSGIEPFPPSHSNTPLRRSMKDGSVAADSLNSTEDPFNYPSNRLGFSPSPVSKKEMMHTPSKMGASLSDAAQEIQENLKKFLASSLKQEEEYVKSPGVNKSDMSFHSNASTSISSSKNSSPSKYRVRFEDEVPFADNEVVRNKRSPYLITSPGCSADVSPQILLESGILPSRDTDGTHMVNTQPDARQNCNKPYVCPFNEEKEKLKDFIRGLETSAFKDPLPSLHFMGTTVFRDGSGPKKQLISDNIPGVGVAADPLKRKQERKNKTSVKKTNPHPGKKEKPNKEVTSKVVRSKPILPSDAVTRKGTGLKKGVQKSNKSSKAIARKERDPVTEKLKAVVAPQFTAEGKETIGVMEAVRGHLQGMLKMDNSSDQKPVSRETTQQSEDDDTLESFRSVDTATLLSVEPFDLMPTVSPDPVAETAVTSLDSATSSIFSILRSHQQPTSTRISMDSSVNAENGILRDTLEKERYRRNHCETQIHNLQNRLLEIQQELAVAKSVARKKNMMIEQLDKTLAKVVEGWKVHENNLTKSIQQLTSEKSRMKDDSDKDKKVIVAMEHEIKKSAEDMSNMRERLLLKDEEHKMLRQTFQLKMQEISQVMDQKNASLEKLINDKHSMVEEIKNLTLKMEAQAEALENEREKYGDREQEWKEATIKLENKWKQEIDRAEKEKDTEKSRYSELQKVLATTQQEVNRLDELVCTLKQTIESIKMQNSVEEAKYSAGLRKIEAEHQIDIERTVTEKLAEFHKEAEQKEKEIRESHHKQVMDITTSHQKELECQCSRYEDKIEQLNRNARDELKEKGEKLNQTLAEKTENMRRQMMNKMQNLLQAHYKETLELVGSTSGNTPKHDTMRSFLHNTHVTGLGTSRFFDSMGFNASTLHFKDSLSQTNRSIFDDDSVRGRRNEVPLQVEKPMDVLKNLDHERTLASQYPPVMSQPLSECAFPLSQNQTNGLAATPVKHHKTDKEADLLNLSLDSFVAQGIPNSVMMTNQHQMNIDKILHGNKFLMPVKPSVADISDYTTTTYTPKQTFEREMNLPEDTSPILDNSSPALQNIQQDMFSHNCSQNLDRQRQLQHYVQMLLDKSPGNPVEVQLPMPSTHPLSIAPLSPVKVANTATRSTEENKENRDTSFYQPSGITSEVAMNVIQFLNQQLQAKQPSPDIIPVRKSELNSGNSPKKVQKGQQRTFQRSNRTGFATQKPERISNLSQRSISYQQSVKKKAEPLPPPKLSVEDLDNNKAAKENTRSQLDEVTHMLSSYMTGETQEAAKKLISYLSESHREKNHSDISMNTSYRKKNKEGIPVNTSGTLLPAWR